MKPSDPQFIYMILVLPAIFGLTLFGEGISKILHDEGGGFISILFGLIFIVIVIFAYYFFSTYLGARI